MRFKPWWLIGAAAAGIIAVVAWQGSGGAAPGPAAASQPAGAVPQFFSEVGSGSAPATPAARAARLQELRQNFELADQTYCTYASNTKYPEASRPVSEHPDQIYPNAPVTEAHAMRTANGGTDGAIQIQTSQSRVFMAAGERAAFSLRAVDADGKPLALVVSRALAQGMTYKDTRPSAQVALPFADDGSGADAVAGDGAFAGVLAPSQTGLAGFNGTIRTEVRYSVNGKSGFVLFDVIYTPELPALWSGQVREALEDGSLVYYLKADIRSAGRYIVHGRVDDAKGKPFALATFNDMLPAGPVEIRLTVFGKLVRDKEAALPLTLRDVDGFLLKENVDPDRALMPRLEGKVLVGKPHPLKSFSDAEWQSEERSRHLEEFSKDIALAQGAISRFDPGLPVPKSSCM